MESTITHQQKIERLEAEKRQLEDRIRQFKHAAQTAERKRLTRVKIILGSLMLKNHSELLPQLIAGASAQDAEFLRSFFRDARAFPPSAETARYRSQRDAFSFLQAGRSNTRCKLTNERTGEKHDWSKHKEDVIQWQVIGPNMQPGELATRAERAENRWDARVGRALDVALPKESASSECQGRSSQCPRSYLDDNPCRR